MRSTGKQPQQLVDSLVNLPSCEQPPASFPVPLELESNGSFQLSSPQPDVNPLSSGGGLSGRPSVSPSGEGEKRSARLLRKESFSTQVANSSTAAAATTDLPTYLTDPYYRTDSLANSERNWRESLRAVLYRYEPEPQSRTRSVPRSHSTGLHSAAKLRASTSTIPHQQRRADSTRPNAIRINSDSNSVASSAPDLLQVTSRSASRPPQPISKSMLPTQAPVKRPRDVKRSAGRPEEDSAAVRSTSSSTLDRKNRTRTNTSTGNNTNSGGNGRTDDRTGPARSSSTPNISEQQSDTASDAGGASGRGSGSRPRRPSLTRTVQLRIEHAKKLQAQMAAREELEHKYDMKYRQTRSRSTSSIASSTMSLPGRERSKESKGASASASTKATVKDKGDDYKKEGAMDLGSSLPSARGSSSSQPKEGKTAGKKEFMTKPWLKRPTKQTSARDGKPTGARIGVPSRERSVSAPRPSGTEGLVRADGYASGRLDHEVGDRDNGFGNVGDPFGHTASSESLDSLEDKGSDRFRAPGPDSNKHTSGERGTSVGDEDGPVTPGAGRNGDEDRAFFLAHDERAHTSVPPKGRSTRELTDSQSTYPYSPAGDGKLELEPGRELVEESEALQQAGAHGLEREQERGTEHQTATRTQAADREEENISLSQVLRHIGVTVESATALDTSLHLHRNAFQSDVLRDGGEVGGDRFTSVSTQALQPSRPAEPVAAPAPHTMHSTTRVLHVRSTSTRGLQMGAETVDRNVQTDAAHTPTTFSPETTINYAPPVQQQQQQPPQPQQHSQPQPPLPPVRATVAREIRRSDSRKRLEVLSMSPTKQLNVTRATDLRKPPSEPSAQSQPPQPSEATRFNPPPLPPPRTKSLAHTHQLLQHVRELSKASGSGLVTSQHQRGLSMESLGQHSLHRRGESIDSAASTLTASEAPREPCATEGDCFIPTPNARTRFVQPTPEQSPAHGYCDSLNGDAIDGEERNFFYGPTNLPTRFSPNWSPMFTGARVGAEAQFAAAGGRLGPPVADQFARTVEQPASPVHSFELTSQPDQQLASTDSAVSSPRNLSGSLSERSRNARFVTSTLMFVEDGRLVGPVSDDTDANHTQVTRPILIPSRSGGPDEWRDARLMAYHYVEGRHEPDAERDATENGLNGCISSGAGVELPALSPRTLRYEDSAPSRATSGAPPSMLSTSLGSVNRSHSYQFIIPPPAKLTEPIHVQVLLTNES